MRVLLVVAVLLAAPVSAVRAQTSHAEQIRQAERLRSEGQAQAAAAMLEPLVHSGSMIPVELGVAWDVLGSSYEDLQMPEKARSCYETSIELLRVLPAEQTKYAAALSNLGSLVDMLGQKDSAKRLYTKANHIYDGLGDTGGTAITATSLAMLAYRQNDFKAARRYLAQAVEQAGRTTGLRDDDIAALDSMQSAMAFHERRYEDSIRLVQGAIDRWTHAYGPAYLMLGFAYAMRAQSIAKLGDYPRALADVRQALAIIEAAHARNTPGYYRTEVVYAQILGASGEREQASQLKKDASRSLTELESRQCKGCTIDASAFR
jgi:tetratricopeptide (TPR) repeat protein